MDLKARMEQLQNELLLEERLRKQALDAAEGHAVNARHIEGKMLMLKEMLDADDMAAKQAKQDGYSDPNTGEAPRLSRQQRRQLARELAKQAESRVEAPGAPIEDAPDQGATPSA